MSDLFRTLAATSSELDDCRAVAAESDRLLAQARECLRIAAEAEARLRDELMRATDLNAAHAEYRAFLEAEIAKEAPFMAVHGMGCSPEVFARGEELRKKIDGLRDLCGLTVATGGE